MNISNQRGNTLHGVLLIALFSCSALYLAEIPFFKELSLSPLIIGIIVGMIYANTLRDHLPQTWAPGIKLCTKEILRLGIVLYGFRLTFQSVIAVGMSAIVVDAIIVVTTIVIGIYIGKLLKMDGDLSLLTATGSAICGAAAVLGTEPVVKAQPHKTAIAVSTVVIFGTISMFIYPALYYTGILGLTPEQMGIYTGSTLHEVAHVVGAGDAMGNNAIADSAIIVKMIRVMMLAPVLLIIGLFVSRKRPKTDSNGKIAIPWFAFGFLAVIGFNSLDLLPHVAINGINYIDTFMLTMAMTALGTETSIAKFKQAGAKPFILAASLYVWLIFGGWALAKYLVPFLS